MSSKLKAVRAGHRSTVIKLFKKINIDRDDSTEEIENDEMQSVIALIKQKQQLLADLDKQILDQTHEGDIADEIEEADGYVLDIEFKLANISKRVVSYMSNCGSSTNANVNVSALNPDQFK